MKNIIEYFLISTLFVFLAGCGPKWTRTGNDGLKNVHRTNCWVNAL